MRAVPAYRQTNRPRTAVRALGGVYEPPRGNGWGNELLKKGRLLTFVDAPQEAWPRSHARPDSLQIRHIWLYSGGGEIRTLGTPIRRTTVFETAAFNRSATPPRATPQG